MSDCGSSLGRGRLTGAASASAAASVGFVPRFRCARGTDADETEEDSDVPVLRLEGVLLSVRRRTADIGCKVKDWS